MMASTYDIVTANVTPALVRQFIDTKVSDGAIEAFIVSRGLKWRGTTWTDTDTAFLTAQVCVAIYNAEGGRCIVRPEEITADMVREAEVPA